MSVAALGILQSGVEIAVPTCEAGIGKVILSPTTSDLIAEVQIKPFSLWPDDRGYFLEVARLQQGLVAEFPSASTQVSAALNYPGIIKARSLLRWSTSQTAPTIQATKAAFLITTPALLTTGSCSTNEAHRNRRRRLYRFFFCTHGIA